MREDASSYVRATGKSAYVHDHTIVLGAPPRDDCCGAFAMHLWGGVDNGMITLVITSRPPFPSTGHLFGFRVFSGRSQVTLKGARRER